MRVFKSHIFCHNNRDALLIQGISALNSQERLKMKVNILGTDYEIVSGSREQYPRLKVADGYTDTSIKQIVILDFNTLEKDDANIKDFLTLTKKVTRHEIIHAFFYESGLWVNSNDVEQWAMNEEMIDWLAIQFPKIYKAFKDADCI